MEKKVSVIIPVYRTEKYLEKCIQSVLNQTYKNLEIIIVNDASPDNSQIIIDKYLKDYGNIKNIILKENKGLFHARLAGYDIATGDYIAFLDSDDYVGQDAYRSMVYKAETTSSDIVFGNIVIEWEADGRQETHIYNEPKFDELKGKEILKNYIEQEGYTFFWYAVWNKLFSKQIFEEARVYFNRITEHTIMAEDVAFCSVLLAMANKVTFVDYYTNYYLQSEISSTNRSNDKGKYIKNITDLCRVMDFIEDFVYLYPKYEPFRDKFHRFKEVFVLYWVTSIQRAKLSKRKKNACLALLKKSAGMKELPNHNREGKRSLTYGVDRSFIYCQLAKFNNKYEKIINYIASNEIKAVVFPVESILLQKHFINWQDYLELLKISYDEIAPKSNTNWITLRKSCEEKLKKDVKIDASIDNIYNEMLKNNVETDLCLKLKTGELELIKKLYTPRKSVRQLYDMASYLQKKIIILVDEFFDNSLTKELLNTNHYLGYDKIVKANKKNTSTEQFLTDIAEKLKFDKQSIVFFNSSENPISKNFINKNIINYPTPICILYKKSDFFNFIKQSPSANATFFQNLLNKSAIVTTANLYFDNPFKPFSYKTDFNKDAYFMGLFPIAFFTLATCIWLVDSKYSEFIINNDETSLIKQSFSKYSAIIEEKKKMFNMEDMKNEVTTSSNKNESRAFFKISYTDDSKNKKLLSASKLNSLCIYGDSRLESEASNVMYLFNNKNVIEIVKYLLGKINPNIEKFYSETLIRQCIENGTNNFMKQIVDVFGKQLTYMTHNNISLSYPFEYLLNQSKYEDISVFDYCSVFIKTQGKHKEESLFRVWLDANPEDSWIERKGNQIAYYPFLEKKSSWIKAIFYLIFDKETLLKKLKTRYSANKRAYKIVQAYERHLNRKNKQHEK